jgi:cytochrome P450
MLNDPDLMPFMPFEPPTEPLSVIAGLRTFLRNYVESFPRAAYEQHTTRIQGRFSDVLLVCDPPLIHDLLVARADAFRRDLMIHRALEPMISATSLFLAEGAEWRWQRRAVAPVFRHEALLSYVPVFAAMAMRQVEPWRAAPGGAPVDVAAAMTRTTFEVIVEILLGSSTAADAARVEQALEVAFKAVLWHGMLGLFGLPRWMPFPGRRRASRACDYLHREMARLVGARRAAPGARRDLVDLLLGARDAESGRMMTDAELATNLLTFIGAGHETTAVALTWTLWLVAKDADVQQRLFAVACAVAGDGPIEAAHVDGLAYTRQVLQEGMRLFPPVPRSRGSHVARCSSARTA